jgi:chemotaxis protein CheD
MRVYGSAAETAPAATDPTEGEEPRTIRVGIAELRTGRAGDRIRSSGFGSCVGVACYDPEAGVGGLAHVMLPETDDPAPERPGKYANTAVPALLSALHEAGATGLRAKLAGGSDMFEFSSTDESVGERNAAAVERELAAAGVPIRGRDVGGDHGRSLSLDVASGDLLVTSAADGDLTL